MALSILNRGGDAGDPIGRELEDIGAAPAPIGRGLPWHTRLGVGWSSGAPPLVLLLLIGAALGPQGLALLTPRVLTVLDPALPVALAALGVQLALHVDLAKRGNGARPLAAAGIETVITALTVGAGLLFLLAPDVSAAPFHAWLIALGGAVCAAMSASASPDSAVSRRHNADLIIAIVFGGLLLAWVREGTLRDAAVVLAQMAVLPILVALAAWLLIGPATSEVESRIFTLSSLLLLGGLAGYLSLSSLLSGLLAGAIWRRLGGPVREAVQRDVAYLQHPLLVLLLLVAGARATTTGATLLLIAAYTVLRIMGKLTGGLAAQRLWKRHVPAGFALALIAPGVFGVAFAISLVRAAGPQAEPLLGAVTAGTIASQLLAAVARRPEPTT